MNLAIIKFIKVVIRNIVITLLKFVIHMVLFYIFIVIFELLKGVNLFACGILNAKGSSSINSSLSVV